MKKRVADTEMDRAKGSSRTIFVITIFLLLTMVSGLGFFVLYDKGMIAFDKDVKKESNPVSKEDKNKKDDKDTKKDTSKDVAIDDVNVVNLFKIVSITGNSCDGYDRQDSVNVSDMSVKCKFSLASHLYLDKLNVAPNGVKYVYESDVKEAYDKLFGYNTYEVQETIPYINNTSLYYNATYSYYFFEGEVNEVGTPITKYEKIISVKRKDDELLITSVPLYYEAINSVLCADVSCANVSDKMNNEPSYPDYYSLYVDHNKDKLFQYTFKFKLDDAGFYNYVGFERTNK